MQKYRCAGTLWERKQVTDTIWKKNASSNGLVFPAAVSADCAGRKRWMHSRKQKWVVRVQLLSGSNERETWGICAIIFSNVVSIIRMDDFACGLLDISLQ